MNFLVGLISVIGLNLVLAGDNAVVIALAAKRLDPQTRRTAMIFGAIGAVIARLVMTGIVVVLLSVPSVRLIGGLLLVWIAWRLVVGSDPDPHVAQPRRLGAAVRTIIVADVVMSLDNVLALAAAARGSFLILAIGVAVSIPIVVLGAAVIVQAMERLPALVWLGGFLVCYTGVVMALADHVVHSALNLDAWERRALALAVALAFTLVAAVVDRRRKSAKTL